MQLAQLLNFNFSFFLLTKNLKTTQAFKLFANCETFSRSFNLFILLMYFAKISAYEEMFKVGFF